MCVPCVAQEMTRVLFGSGRTGPEYYEKAQDSMMQPLNVSHRARIARGQYKFKAQVGRIPLHRAGTRAAACGVFPSHWEPGMGYSETIPPARNRATHVVHSHTVHLPLGALC